MFDGEQLTQEEEDLIRELQARETTELERRATGEWLGKEEESQVVAQEIRDDVDMKSLQKLIKQAQESGFYEEEDEDDEDEEEDEEDQEMYDMFKRHGEAA